MRVKDKNKVYTAKEEWIMVFIEILETAIWLAAILAALIFLAWRFEFGAF